MTDREQEEAAVALACALIRGREIAWNSDAVAEWAFAASWRLRELFDAQKAKADGSTWVLTEKKP